MAAVTSARRILAVRQSPHAGSALGRVTDPERRLPMEQFLQLLQHVLEVVSMTLTVVDRTIDLLEKYRRWWMTRRQKKRD